MMARAKIDRQEKGDPWCPDSINLPRLEEASAVAACNVWLLALE